MKRAVLYTKDLEPITVLELDINIYNYLVSVGRVRLYVPTKPMTDHYTSEAKVEINTIHTLELHAEELRYHNEIHYLLTVHPRDEESSLLLKSALLPGQVKEVNDRVSSAKISAFTEGVIFAITRLQFRG